MSQKELEQWLRKRKKYIRYGIGPIANRPSGYYPNQQSFLQDAFKKTLEGYFGSNVGTGGTGTAEDYSNVDALRAHLGINDASAAAAAAAKVIGSHSRDGPSEDGKTYWQSGKEYPVGGKDDGKGGLTEGITLDGKYMWIGGEKYPYGSAGADDAAAKEDSGAKGAKGGSGARVIGSHSRDGISADGKTQWKSGREYPVGGRDDGKGGKTDGLTADGKDFWIDGERYDPPDKGGGERESASGETPAPAPAVPAVADVGDEVPSEASYKIGDEIALHPSRRGSTFGTISNAYKKDGKWVYDVQTKHGEKHTGIKDQHFKKYDDWLQDRDAYRGVTNSGLRGENIETAIVGHLHDGVDMQDLLYDIYDSRDSGVALNEEVYGDSMLNEFSPEDIKDYIDSHEVLRNLANEGSIGDFGNDKDGNLITSVDDIGNVVWLGDPANPQVGRLRIGHLGDNEDNTTYELVDNTGYVLEGGIKHSDVRDKTKYFGENDGGATTSSGRTNRVIWDESSVDRARTFYHEDVVDRDPAEFIDEKDAYSPLKTGDTGEKIVHPDPNRPGSNIQIGHQLDSGDAQTIDMLRGGTASTGNENPDHYGAVISGIGQEHHDVRTLDSAGNVIGGSVLGPDPNASGPTTSGLTGDILGGN